MGMTLAGNAGLTSTRQSTFTALIHATAPAPDVEDSMEMHVQVDGEFPHLFISTFDHDVTSRAIAHGYTSMPDVFEADCDAEGVSYSLGPSEIICQAERAVGAGLAI